MKVLIIISTFMITGKRADGGYHNDEINISKIIEWPFSILPEKGDFINPAEILTESDYPTEMPREINKGYENEIKPSVNWPKFLSERKFIFNNEYEMVFKFKDK